MLSVYYPDNRLVVAKLSFIINGTKQLFRDLKLLTFDDIYKLARYTYCQVSMILPVSLIRHYGLNADIHGYNIR